MNCIVCGKEINNELCRIDDGKYYHARCFNVILGHNNQHMKECIMCNTFGFVWNKETKEWNTCPRCHGHGIIDKNSIKI